MGHYYSEMISDKTANLRDEYFALRERILKVPMAFLSVEEYMDCAKFLEDGGPGLYGDVNLNLWVRIEAILKKVGMGNDNFLPEDEES